MELLLLIRCPFSLPLALPNRYHLLKLVHIRTLLTRYHIPT